MLYSTVIIVLIASCCVLSADAILCHQCHSNADANCLNLRGNVTHPDSPNTQYLKKCVGEFAANAFCRKIVTKIEVTGEQSVIRRCGWLKEDESKFSCIRADNEGYKQLICACYKDGCNAAPPLHATGQSRLLAMAGGVAFIAAALMRRSG